MKNKLPLLLVFALTLAADAAATSDDPLSRIEVQTGFDLSNDFFHIAENAPMSWRSSRTPWMDRRWRLDKGMIGDRYLDSNFRKKTSFKSRYQYILDFDFLSIARKLSERSATIKSELSPAEKYDLLVGDERGTLTRKLWDYSKNFDDQGRIDTWMALCDGSAAASIVLDEPRKEVKLVSPINNTPIVFSPYDVKALASLFYSEISIPHIPIVGGRCNGNMSSRECNDPSPDQMHRVLTQLGGIHNWPVIFDRTAGVPIWNYPVVSYRLRYFNPSTRHWTDSYKQAVVRLDRWKNDVARNKRSAAAVATVGIAVKVELPGAATEASERYSTVLRVVDYQYQIDIDSSGHMVGGQWESKERPDFIWTTDPNSWPRSYADGRLPRAEWTHGSAVPSEWLPVIQQSSSRGQPIVGVLSKLLKLSSQ